MTDSTGITRVLAVVNDAGSAGKTTTAVTLAAIAAERGARVVVVDLDPQANATRWLGIDPDTITVNSGAVLLRQATLTDALVDTNTPGVRLLPASEALKAQRLDLGRLVGAEQRLRAALRDVDADVVLIDCQAGSGELYPLTAMVAATHVLTVTLPGPKELEGLPRVEDMVADIVDAYNADLTLAAIVPCNVPSANRGALYQGAVDMLREAYKDLVTPSVRQSVVAVQSYDVRLPLPLSHPHAAVTEDYRAVATYLSDLGALPNPKGAQA